MEGVIAIIMVFSIPLAAIFTAYRYKMEKLKSEKGGGDVEELKKQIGYLMAENEDMQDRMKRIEQGINNQTELDRKPLPDYLKTEEKIKLDK